MIPKDTEGFAHCGIEAVYFLGNDITFDHLQELQQKADLTLNGNDPILQKNCADNLILIGSPTKLLIQSYLQFLSLNSTVEVSLRAQALNNWQEILQTVKEKKFVLVTHRNLSINTPFP
jgi:hypothetical protein